MAGMSGKRWDDDAINDVLRQAAEVASSRESERSWKEGAMQQPSCHGEVHSPDLSQKVCANPSSSASSRVMDSRKWVPARPR